MKLSYSTRESNTYAKNVPKFRKRWNAQIRNSRMYYRAAHVQRPAQHSHVSKEMRRLCL